MSILFTEYGSPFKDPNEIEKGPQIIVEPENVVVIPGETRTFLVCVATGQPIPTYKWYRGTNFEEINSKTDSRYTLTNGKLTISQPQDALDAEKYQCEATNKFGSVLSQKAQLSFGGKHIRKLLIWSLFTRKIARKLMQNSLIISLQVIHWYTWKTYVTRIIQLGSFSAVINLNLVWYKVISENQTLTM